MKAKVATKIVLSNTDECILNDLHSRGSLGRRGAEIFQLLLLRDDFRPLVKLMRDSLGMTREALAENGSQHFDQIAEQHFVNGAVIRDTAYPAKYSINGNPGDILNKYISEKILPLLQTKDEEGGLYGDLFTDSIIERMLCEYILTNTITMIGCEVGMVHYDEEPIGWEQEIVFTFMATATKEDVHSFIDNNWDAVIIFKEKILQNRAKRRMIKADNFIRDVKIYNAYIDRMNTQSKSGYASAKIANALRKEGIKLSDEAVMPAITRLRRRLHAANL